MMSDLKGSRVGASHARYAADRAAWTGKCRGANLAAVSTRLTAHYAATAMAGGADWSRHDDDATREHRWQLQQILELM